MSNEQIDVETSLIKLSAKADLLAEVVYNSDCHSGVYSILEEMSKELEELSGQVPGYSPKGADCHE